MKIFGRGCADEIIVLAWMKFEAAGGRAKTSEGDGEVQELVGFAANSDDSGLGVGDSARFEFLTTDTVDDMPFGVLGIGFGNWTNNVDLIVFPRKITSVDIDDMISIVQPEHGICSVPVNVVDFAAFSHFRCGKDDAKHHHVEMSHLDELHLLAMIFIFL